MICYTKEGNIIKKELINFDPEEIKKYRKRLIERCSPVEHVKKYSNKPIYFNPEDEFVINVHREILTYENTDNHLYIYEYDVISKIKLVRLLDRLLKEDPTVVEEIRNYKDEDEENIPNKINSLIKELKKALSTNDFSEQLRLSHEIKKYTNINNNSKYKLAPSQYTYEIQNAIKVESTETISANTIREVENFIGIEEPYSLVLKNKKVKKTRN